MVVTVEERVSRAFQLFKECGDSQYIGEPISKSSHSIQCGMLAEKEGYPVQTILGAFFHDIGHLVGEVQGQEPMITNGVNYGAQNHDVLGESFLQELGFPPEVTDIVRGHVNAKRYLVFKDKDYYNRLSDASKRTLVHQGGPMTPDEAESFERSPRFKEILRMRQWDERAKEVDIELDGLGKFKQMSIDYLMALEGS